MNCSSRCVAQVQARARAQARAGEIASVMHAPIAAPLVVFQIPHGLPVRQVVALAVVRFQLAPVGPENASRHTHPGRQNMVGSTASSCSVDQS